MTKEEETRINATLATLQDAFNFMVNLRAASEARAILAETRVSELQEQIEATKNVA